jgi:hypothetical protein
MSNNVTIYREDFRADFFAHAKFFKEILHDARRYQDIMSVLTLHCPNGLLDDEVPAWIDARLKTAGAASPSEAAIRDSSGA